MAADQQPGAPAAGPTLPQINDAIEAAAYKKPRRALRRLKKLLAEGPRPQVPLVEGEYHDPLCFSYDGSEYSDINDVQGLRDPLFTLLHTGGPQDCRVAVCEALLAAGFRPTVYPQVEFEAREPDLDDLDFIDRLTLSNLDIVFGWSDPEVAAKVAEFERGVPNRMAVPELDGPNRLLAMLIRGEPWSPANHQHYPPALRAAVRTLLLAHRRGGCSSAPSAAGGLVTRSAARRAATEAQFCALSQLPPECLMLVVRQLAAAPLAPWLFKQPWTEVQVPNPDDLYNYADYGPEYDYDFGFDGDGRCPECGEYHSDDCGAFW